MRLRLIFGLLLFCFVNNIFSQNIFVRSFKLLDTDLTANTKGTSEIDQNGETSALIKIVTTEKGFTFDCGMLGIVKTKQTPGEVWLYLPRGAQKVTIKHPHLGVLRDYYFPITIEGARTYEMVLTTRTVTSIVKEARTSQYVVFQLSPKNAIVEFEGQLLQTTEGVARKLIKFGTYRYKVQAPDYLPYSGEITVDNPEEKSIVNINLKPNFTSVTLAVAGDAEIWVNGEKKGQATWSGNLGSGEYEFEARKDNYRSSICKKIINVPSEPLTFQLDEPQPIFGEANFDSNPAMADIILDGKKIGQTPLLTSEILIGNHKIRISKYGYETYTQDIVIDENNPFEFFAHLNKIADFELKKVELSSKLDSLTLGKTGKKTDDGGEYYGTLKKGKPNGLGKALYKNGNSYEGYYSNGKRHGYGIYKFYDGEIYEGEWANDQQNGKGTYFFLNNNRYEGDWFRDFQHGHGIMYYFNGDKYDGDWKQDKRAGHGLYTFSNGAYYDGEWENDMKNGQGLFDWGDGSSYDGQWKNNKRNGKGTFKYANGDSYIGQWVNDVMEGKGVFVHKNGDRYEGDFKNGERTGLGHAKYASGDKYYGAFVNGKRNGYGTYNWKSGAIYIGQWENDQPNGKGKLTDVSGKIIEGYFKDGQPLSKN